MYRQMVGFSRFTIRVSVIIKVWFSFIGAILYIAMTWPNIQSGTERTRLFTFIVQLLYFYNKTRKYDNVHVSPRT